MTVDELRNEMLDGFKTMRAEFKTEIKAIKSEMKAIKSQIKAEGEKTRRHFNIMVEKVNDSVRIVAEATAHHAVRLDDHEKRITRLE